MVNGLKAWRREGKPNEGQKAHGIGLVADSQMKKRREEVIG
jgi:hypothetical protein